LTRNVLDRCPKQLRGELKHRLHGLFNAPDLETARTLLDGMIAEEEEDITVEETPEETEPTQAEGEPPAGAEKPWQQPQPAPQPQPQPQPRQPEPAPKKDIPVQSFNAYVLNVINTIKAGVILTCSITTIKTTMV